MLWSQEKIAKIKTDKKSSKRRREIPSVNG